MLSDLFYSTGNRTCAMDPLAGRHPYHLLPELADQYATPRGLRILFCHPDNIPLADVAVEAK